MNCAIELNRLTKVFSGGWRRRHTVAVDDVSFTVSKGDVFGLLGENGAGKTVTLQLILGLLNPTSGQVRVLGKHPGDIEVKKKIGYLPERPRFHAYLSGEEFLRFHAELCGLNKSQENVAVEKLLCDFRLEEARNKKIRAYSRGMLQRIGLAQALLSSPQILFLDEPTSGLDPTGVILLRDIILRLREDGVCVFLNSHHLSEVERICNRIAFMKAGRTIEIVDLESLRADSLEIEITLVSQFTDAEAVLGKWKVLSLEERAGRTTIVVMVASERDIDAVVAAIRDRKGRIVSVVPRNVSLEQLFMKCVQER